MPNITEKISVKKLTPYGFQSDSGEYVNWAPRLNESEKGKIVPGATYELDLFVSEGGKKYVNGVKQVGLPAAKPVPKKVEPKVEKAKEEKPAVDWAAKDRSQLIGGLSHDAATLAATLSNVSGVTDSVEALKLYKELLVGMLKIRDEIK